ncbi:Site-specific DNA-methyltransferase [Sandaracinus amylolyticus]|nr:site-specific DNA-methyltransferase [Sandaracinus amylolyticus]UJR81790.1 Site-specific DNA-methyltransferase [Sandaracinus amylolyticus]
MAGSLGKRRIASKKAALRRIVHGESLAALATLPDACARLVYIDPPFNTGRVQSRRRLRVTRDEEGERIGFQGARYRVEKLDEVARYDDKRGDDYVPWLMTRIEASLRCLSADGSIFVHVDPRESHYVKVALDGLLGRASFVNEIVWAYDYGARTKKRWPAKHDVLLWYARDPKRYVFDHDAIDRVPYMAPKLVGPEKAARGKTPTDVWWNTIVPTNGREKTGYPTQKPLAILERIVRVHSAPGDVVLDFFAGSGTTGEAAAKHDRGFVLIDSSRDAVRVMKTRLAAWEPEMVRVRSRVF